MSRRVPPWRHGLDSIDDDSGMTLAEMLIGMAVMVVALAIFTSVIFAMSNVASSVEGTSESSSRVDNAFLRLDRTVRYASAVSTPSTVANSSSKWYVELQTVNDGTTKCTQVQLDTAAQKVFTRSWTIDSTGSASTPTAFRILANQVTAPGTGVPFQMTPTGSYGNSPYEQLVVRLQSTSGNGRNAKTSQMLSTFTALNSNVASARAVDGSLPASRVCQEVGRP